MNTLRKLFTAIGALSLSVAVSGPAGAVPFSEIGDAGDLPATAQAVSVPGGVITSISGVLGDAAAADMFQILIPNPAAFSANTFGTFSSSGFNTDTQLFLFDSAGFGVLANDDAGSLDSELPLGSLTGPAGIYYLAVSAFDNDPVNAGGLIFPSFPFGDLFGPTGPGGAQPISGWTAGGGTSSTYTINLTGAFSVPEPATLALLGLGLAGLGFARKRAR